ncbi:MULTISPECIES: hypothetical protein [unclassified Variovorax]|uniref:hypothetical protein n=1 Tax=unclassified Variovorax TaxID=663243 RepID=UPI002B230BD5|nr:MULTISPECIES: hypothetical protein [unclassified Variovorax]MEB0059131.1 hypothetical protein [Variovorax sp. LG9.2]MEB0112862.1 hypothetical protein [Variovorax sp. RTB1]
MARSIDLPALRRRLLLALPAMAFLDACAGPSWSSSAPLASTTTGGRWLQLEVVDRDTGQSLPVYASGGERYVPGRPGARYGLRIRNLRRERVLVVMAVDGVNVLTGQTAGWQQNGYVLGPLDAGQIDGWRKTDREIAAFEFTAQAQSYAARTGRPLDVGVIGIAVFRERVSVAAPMPLAPRQALRRDGSDQGAAQNERSESDGRSERRERSVREAPAPSASPVPETRGEAKASAGPSGPSSEFSADSTAKLGTGHGQREESVVGHTRFERAASAPEAVIAVRYDSRANLVRMGVLPADVDVPDRPRPFPANPRNPQYGFVPDPGHW